MDWLNELFAGETRSQDEINACLEAALQEEKKRLADIKKEKEKHRCPKCQGEGRISSYQHIKAGECFLCGGTGQFYGKRKSH